LTDTLPPPLTGIEPGGVFFLWGEDEFRKQEAARALVELHLDASTRDFNYDPVRGGEVELETLASLLATPPMMAPWRVVLIREAEALAQSSRARELITDLLESPPEGLAVVLVTSIPQGSRAKFYRELKKGARSIEFPEISANDVPGWILARVGERHGLEIEEEAARALGAAVGTELGVLAQEIDKLASLVEEGETITLSHVEAGGTRLPEQDRWRWFDLVGERRFSEALEGLGVLLDQGESGVGLTIGLGTHLLRVGTAAAGGRKAVEELLPAHLRGWLAPKIAGQAKAWEAEEVEEALMGLRRADRLLKSSGFDDALVLEEWLLGLIARAEEAAA